MYHKQIGRTGWFAALFGLLALPSVALAETAATTALVQQAYLKASNTNASDFFGVSVAIDGDTVVVGATEEASNATGVNGDQTNNSLSSAGAAYVFVRNGGVWTQQAYLKASNTEANDRFGHAVAVSGDTIVVSAPDESSNATGVNGNQGNNSASMAGAVYVFVRSGTTWTQQAYLKASNPDAEDRFGQSLAIFGDTIVVGANGERSKATGVNGDQTDNSAPLAGAAYVFVRNGSTWTQQAYLKASNTGDFDTFGTSSTIFGDTIIIGASFEASNATGVNGDQANNSATDAGAAYVFVRNGVTWSQQAYLKASNTGAGDAFGRAVGISGDTAVVSAFFEASSTTGVNGDQTDNSASGSGAAYVFVRNGTTWSQQAYLKASNTGADDLFGTKVGISGDNIVVGANDEDSNATGINGDQTNNSAGGAGAAYVFVRNGTTWNQRAYVKASNAEGPDNFGRAVGISGDSVLIAAEAEDSAATGVNGDQTDNNAPTAGAAYVFNVSGQLLNIATRLRVLTGENVLIGGFIITGTDPKKVVLRGIGPSLSSFFSDALANPTLELFQGNTLLDLNDDWIERRAEIEATGIPPANDLEAALVRDLAPGAYTAILRGKNNSAGIGIVEAYDLNQAANSKLANISTRGFVDTNDNVMIGGLIAGPTGAGTTRVVVRAIGPSLGNFGISGALQDPTLDLVNSSGVILRSNDNWKLSQRTEIEALGLQPGDDRESALVETLAPGNYTAVVRGNGNTTGVGLVEVYNVP